MIKRPILALASLALTTVAVFVAAFLLGRETIEISNPEDFLVVTSVTVEDTPYGMDPAMDVDREIRQNFAGNWVATIRPVASLEYACGNSGSAPYRPDATLPEDLKLFDFWLFDRGEPETLCRAGYYPLPRGCYYVDTTWDFADPLFLNTLSVHHRSNEFCVE